MGLSEGISNSGPSRRDFIKQVTAFLLSPKPSLSAERRALKVTTITKYIKKRALSALLKGIIRDDDLGIDEMEYPLSDFLLRGIISVDAPQLNDEELRKRIEAYLRKPDEDTSLPPNKAILEKLVTEWIGTGSFSHALALVQTKHDELMEIVGLLPANLQSAVNEYPYWIDENSKSHIFDFMRQFWSEIIGNDSGEELLSDEDYLKKMNELAPILERVELDMNLYTQHYHDRYIEEELGPQQSTQLEAEVQKFSSGKWTLEDMKKSIVFFTKLNTFFGNQAKANS